MRGCPNQSVRSTKSTLVLFSSATLQVAFFAVLIMFISSVGCLFIVWNAMPTCRLKCLHVAWVVDLSFKKLTGTKSNNSLNTCIYFINIVY